MAIEMVLAFLGKKLDRAAEQLPLESATPATAHMFIINPLRASMLQNLFSTHPPLEERVERLQRVAAELGLASGKV